MRKRTNVIELGSDWWTKERAPSETMQLVQPRRRSLPEGKLYPLKHFADKLGVGMDLLYTACRSGELYHERVGRQYRITQRWVEEWLDRCRRKCGSVS